MSSSYFEEGHACSHYTDKELRLICEELRKSDQFQAFVSAVQGHIKKGKARQCLSHHTTASCRTRRGPTPIESLKSIGLEKDVQGSSPGTVCRKLSFEHTFYDNDSWPMEYIPRDYPGQRRHNEDGSSDYFAT